MKEKFRAIMSVIVTPMVVELLVEKEGLDDVSAITEFYHSKTYSMLAQEETKTWHYSPLTLYHMWKDEKETGELIWPEEGGCCD